MRGQGRCEIYHNNFIFLYIRLGIKFIKSKLTEFLCIREQSREQCWPIGKNDSQPSDRAFEPRLYTNGSYMRNSMVRKKTLNRS